jgi:hypothetical protein
VQIRCHGYLMLRETSEVLLFSLLLKIHLVWHNCNCNSGEKGNELSSVFGCFSFTWKHPCLSSEGRGQRVACPGDRQVAYMQWVGKETPLLEWFLQKKMMGQKPFVAGWFCGEDTGLFCIWPTALLLLHFPHIDNQHHHSLSRFWEFSMNSEHWLKTFIKWYNRFHLFADLFVCLCTVNQSQASHPPNVLYSVIKCLPSAQEALGASNPLYSREQPTTITKANQNKTCSQLKSYNSSPRLS